MLILQVSGSKTDTENLEGMPFITLPFADDKKLMIRLHDLTSSMGLEPKPRKWRFLSI